MEAIAIGLEAIATRVEAVAVLFQGICSIPREGEINYCISPFVRGKGFDAHVAHIHLLGVSPQSSVVVSIFVR